MVSDNRHPKLFNNRWLTTCALTLLASLVLFSNFSSGVVSAESNINANIETRAIVAQLRAPSSSTLGTIGNSVWLDENSDGVQDAGEAGVPNVTVRLYNNTGGAQATTVTDGHGGFRFNGLPAGVYYVDVDESTLPTGMTQTTTYPQAGGDFTNQNHSATTIPNTALTGYMVSVGNGAALENLSADFGYNFSLTDNVVGDCFDVISNQGFENFESSVNFTPMTFDDFDGDTLQAYAWGTSDSSIDDWIPTISDQSPFVTAFLIDDTAGEINNPEGDYFAYLPGGDDEAFNCVEQNVEVFLSAGLVPGRSYEMCYMAAAGTVSDATAYIEFAFGPNYLGPYNQALPRSTSSTNLNWQQVCLEFDYDPEYMDRIVISQHGMSGISIDAMQMCEVGSTTGGQDNGAIGDRVWIDSDGDGAQDPNEIGVSGVTVTLYHDPDGDGVYSDVYDTTTTNVNGNYIFLDLPPAAYVVTVTSHSGASHPILNLNHSQTGDPDHFGTTGTPNDNTTTTPIVLAPGDVFLNADFGYQPQGNASVGSIGDTIFFDADGDGNGPALAPVDGGAVVTQGAGGTADNTDYGIAGVTVALIRDSNNNGQWDTGEPIVGSDTTDANGQYLFTGLDYDNYLVWVNDTANVLDGLTPTYDKDGSNPVAGLEVGLGISAAVVGSATEDVRDQDFGFNAGGLGLIGDTVFLNIDGDDVQDANEPGLEGVIVTLNYSGGTATTITNENGQYYFGGLDPNVSYTITIAPENFNAGGVLEGLSNTADPEDNDDNTSVANLGAAGSDGNNDPDGVDNGINLGQDFGYTPTNPATIGNLIWLDVNADGVHDGGVETPIGGVTVSLYRDLNGNGQIDAGEPFFGSTTTDASINAGSYQTNGNYLFRGLPAGNYVVDVTDRDGVLVGYWHSLGEAGTDNNSQTDPYGVSVVAGGTNISADFGYYLDPACVGNFFWDDSASSNGIQDAGEPGINGVTMTLTITYPSGDVTVLKTVTGDDPSTTGVTEVGWYSFCNLLSDENHRIGSGAAAPASGQPGFEISAELPANMIPTIINATAATTQTDSEDPAGAPVTPIQGGLNVIQEVNPINEGNPTASYDFGATLPTQVGNRIWYESDNDGLAATGTISPAIGLVVSLADANGSVYTTTTDATGTYNFDVPVNALYTISVPTPGGYDPSIVNVTGIDSDPNSDNDSSHNSNGAVVQVFTDANQTIDFAFTSNPTFAIGNLVWIDGEAIGNGQYNPNNGDVRVENVTMELYRVNNGTVESDPLQTTETGTGVLQAGAYQFTGLGAGTYVVCVAGQEFTPAGDLWYSAENIPYGVVATNSGGTSGNDDNLDHNTVYVGNVTIQPVCSNHITFSPGTNAPFAENAHGLTTNLSDASVDWSVDFAFAPPSATAVNLSGTGTFGAPIVPLLISVVISILLAGYFMQRNRAQTARL